TQVASSYSVLNTQSTVSLDKLYRSGIGLSSSISLARNSPYVFQGLALNQVVASSNVTVPLRQGRHGGLAMAVERAASEDVAGAVANLRSAGAGAVLRAALAYWQYRAAYERASIQRAAGERSRRSVNEVQVLIQADERPRSDMDLMAANAASKRVLEIQADQQVNAARWSLALALGFDAAAALRLSDPIT